MHKQINLLYVQYDSAPDFTDLQELYTTFLGNAQKHVISIFST